MKSEDDYRAEDDHRTVERAEEIKADATRMAGVKRHHLKKTAAIDRMNKLMGGGRKSTRPSAMKRSMPSR